MPKHNKECLFLLRRQLAEYAKATPEALLKLPFILAEILGTVMASPTRPFCGACSVRLRSEAEALEPDPVFPLLMTAGWHMDNNANTLMRDPAWNKGRRVGCQAVHADDAQALGLADGGRARLTTKAGQA